MNFKERYKPDTKLQVLQTHIPRVYIASQALAKMYIYVDECKDEIGWMGTVQELGDNIYVIDDVFLFDQDVHGATTEITPEGLSDFAEELLQRPDGVKIWNSMRMWGHSHVNMGVSPSGQDDKQMKDFANIGHDWFIRLIANKQGEMKLDFFHYKNGIIYNDVPWEEEVDEEEENLQEEVYRLQALIETLKEKRVETLSPSIKEEMKTKVRKMSFGGKQVGFNNSKVTSSFSDAQGGYANIYGRRNSFTQNQWALWDKVPPTEQEKVMYKHLLPLTMREESVSTTTTPNTTGSSTKTGRYADIHYFRNDDEVRQTFSMLELINLSELINLDELEVELEYMGYVNMFSDEDLERIFRVAFRYRKEDE